jgi:hypothetical protein
MRHTTWWWLSAAVSAILITVLINLWTQMNAYHVQPTQLINEKATTEYLKNNWENRPESLSVLTEPIIKIKTGIFIQSLQFSNSTEVNITGYIWQHYEDGVHDAIKPGVSKDGVTEAGFILPEQVNSGSDIEPREVYRIRNGDEEVIGWYFEATLRQPFNYDLYPFDHKTVWVRMWPKDFSRNIVLVPDFEAYKSTGLSDIFGIESKIVLGTWERENTYFDYKLSSYNTDFGIANYIGQEGFPELNYNFVLKRKFENAFIIHLLPLFLVATLLFAALLTVTEDEKLSGKLGFNTSGFIAASSALFFVVLLAHIQLREQFAGAGIVYIEYFYIIMYALLVMATANSYLFSVRAKFCSSIILFSDNIIVKVAYWPVVLTSLILVTLLVL